MPAPRDLARFRRERNRALRSLDAATIDRFCAAWGVPMPADRSPGGPYWAGVHKARVACLDLTEAERQASRRWLAAHGYRPDVGRAVVGA